MSVKILLNGINGRMGQAIASAASGECCEIFAACDIDRCELDKISECDAAIDFSFREATAKLAKLCAKNKTPLVIGTTGHTPEQRAEILKYAEIIPIVWAGNYSVGVNLLNYLVKIAAKILPETYDVEILEMHHHFKKDAPSGTAEKLINVVKEARGTRDDQIVHGRNGQVGERPKGEIGVHALRGGSVVGEHRVLFAADGEIVELAHKAEDRKIFAAGALRAAKWAASAKPGLYGMEDVLGLK